MMTAPSHADQHGPKPPHEVRCRTCGGWLATVPAGTTWTRSRCMNKRCALYGEGQTVKLR